METIEDTSELVHVGVLPIPAVYMDPVLIVDPDCWYAMLLRRLAMAAIYILYAFFNEVRQKRGKNMCAFL